MRAKNREFSNLKGLAFALALLAAAFWYYGVKFTATLLIISFLVFFHELGHFLVAKFFGVKVRVFSIGFGQRLFGREIGGTDYRVSAIPLGGYVQLKGQNDADPSEKSTDPDSYGGVSAWKRVAILFAGPAFNVLLAFLLYGGVGYLGVDKLAASVGGVLENSASVGILERGDKILAINGHEVREWDEMKNLIAEFGAGEKPLELKIERGGKVSNLNITPRVGLSRNIFGEEIHTPLVGIAPSGEFVTVYHRGFESLSFAASETWEASKLTILGLEKLILGIVPVKDMAGIVGIADITTRAAGLGASTLMLIAALISVNLGLLNLLPLPVLDGGHIVFNLYEMIFRRPVSERVFVALSYASMALLLALMAFTVVNDILRMSGAYK